MKQTTFQRAQGLTPAEVASLMQRGIIGIKQPVDTRKIHRKYATVEEQQAAKKRNKQNFIARRKAMGLTAR